MSKYSFVRIFILYLPDVFILLGMIFAYIYKEYLSSEILRYSLMGIGSFLLLQSITLKIGYKYLFVRRIKNIIGVIDELKRGKYIVSQEHVNENDELAKIFNELIIIGRHVNEVLTIQKFEIEKFYEFYNDIILLVDSYLVILNEKREIIFANDSFCKKFQVDLEEIIGRNINEIFIFVTNKINEAITQVKSFNNSILLEKIHLFSKKKISIIADMKLSKIATHGWEHISLIIDDITTRCKKDYQINVLEGLSDLTYRDEKNNTNLYTILSSITSKNGLGFARAMLFLLDEREKSLRWEMIVGSDSTLKIQNILSGSGGYAAFTNPDNGHTISIVKSMRMPDMTESIIFDMDSNNIFVRSLKNQEIIHIQDSNGDDRVDNEVREFMNVDEFVVVPLIVDNRAIGLIIADNLDTPIPIIDDHIQLLSTFSLQVALYIENNRIIFSLEMQMEAMRRRQKSMVESERLAAVGRVATHLAHEIRNPLVTMGGYARRIEKLAENDVEVLRAADIIIKESKRLEDILSNIMDFTKISSFVIEYNNVNDAINETMELLWNQLKEKGIEVSLRLNKQIPLLRVDFNQIKQVILNLLQNSIEATGPKDKIEIITDVDDGHVTITIGDTGHGIGSENIDNIFEPFFTTKVTGIGLGLAIVNKIIRDHNGRITIRNKETGGAEFSIMLPISQ
ncbi:MAG: ATP-binding protein [Spirochaetota bacterium]|nr:ATP-binding protein [Spirochaetota bacterium]